MGHTEINKQQVIEAELDISNALIWIVGRFYEADKAYWKASGDLKQFISFEKYLLEQGLIKPKQQENGKSGN